MVSWDVYSDIIMPLKFFISYINIIVLKRGRQVDHSVYLMFRGHVPSRKLLKSGTI